MNQLDSSPKCIQSSDFQTSKYILTDEKSFYYRFEEDLFEAKREVIIESPFITIPKYSHIILIVPQILLKYLNKNRYF